MFAPFWVDGTRYGDMFTYLLLYAECSRKFLTEITTLLDRQDTAAKLLERSNYHRKSGDVQ